MTLFAFGVAALLAMALVQLLPALLKPVATTGAGRLPQDADLAVLREQMAQLDADLASGAIAPEQHARDRQEIARRALEADAGGRSRGRSAQPSASVGSAWAVGLGVPVLALALYGGLGNREALQQADAPARAAARADDGVTQEQIEAMVARLAQRLENAPAGEAADPAAWEMLARSYAAMQRFDDADRAYARATALAPDNAQLLADRADVLAMLQGRSAAGEPSRLIARALAIDPANLKALALAGSAAFERGDMAAAVGYWTQAQRIAPPGSAFADGLARSLEEARAGGAGAGAGPVAESGSVVRAGSAFAPAAGSGAGTGAGAGASPAAGPLAGVQVAQAAGGPSVAGQVRLAPALAARVAPGDTVFIFARPVQGPRMPLAVLRRTGGELPLAFTLDDRAAMSADLRLPASGQVMLVARVSRSGNATPQSGDLVGEVGPVAIGAQGVALTIDRVQP